MSGPIDVARNQRAIRNLAGRLERMGYTGDCHAEAEHIALNLAADGWRPVEKPPPMRGSHSSPAARAAARQACADAVTAAKQKGRR